MMEFQKGILTDEGFISEGTKISMVTIQGEILQGVLVMASKKKIEIQLNGEIGTRTFEVEVVSNITEV